MAEPFDSSPFWALNPGLNMDIAFDHGIQNFVMTERTFKYKRNMAIDPFKQVRFFARGRPWRVMVVDYHVGVTHLYDHRHGFGRVIGNFPGWSAKEDDFHRLHRLCTDYPQAGEVIGTFGMDSEPSLAVEGQPQVIMIRNPPHNQFDWRTMMASIVRLKRTYPEIQFHIHGGKSLHRTLGVSVDQFDHPVTIAWEDGRPQLLLPNGTSPRVPALFGRDHEHWAKIIGENLAEYRRLTDRRDLARYAYRFNLRSIIWAVRNEEKLYNFGRVRSTEIEADDIDIESSDLDWQPPDRRYRPKIANIGDKWLCDTCTISHRCPYARAGALCIVDGTEGNQLSKKFGSRKASEVIDGLSTLMEFQAKRLEKAAISEEQAASETGEYRLSPQLTALVNGVFDRGIQLARLLDPQVASQMSQGGKINVAINNPNAGSLANASQSELAAALVAKLEFYGIEPAKATVEQVQAIMRGEEPPGIHAAIEAASFDGDDDDESGYEPD